MKNELKIELAYLDKLTTKTLTYFLQSNLCKAAKLKDPTEETDLYIVDQYKLKKGFLDKHIKGKQKSIIILHNNNEEQIKIDNILYLKKPIDTYKLVKLITKVQANQNVQNLTQSNLDAEIKTSMIQKDKHIDAQHNQLYNAVHEENKLDIHQRFKAQKFVGSNKDITNTIKIPDNIYLNKNKYLYHYLIKAKNLAKINQSSILLKNTVGNILYNPWKRVFIHKLQTTQLKYIQTSTLAQDIEMEFINEKAVNDFMGNNEINEVKFIWESAIQASKGRIPRNTSLNQSVNLIAWPNFSKLQIFRYAIQISAVWAKYNLSLIETAKQLQIPQRYVFTLYCAMHAMGYANINKNIDSESIESNKNQSSLFSKIIKHMFG